MQALAREMNFSETTFVLPAEQGEDRAGSDLPRRTSSCGSPATPTLGTAFVLGSPLWRSKVRLETGAGAFGRQFGSGRTVARIVRRGAAAAGSSRSTARRRSSRPRCRTFELPWGVRQRHAARLRLSGLSGRRRRAPAGRGRARPAAADARRELHRRRGDAVEEPHVRARGAGARIGHGLRRRAAGLCRPRHGGFRSARRSRSRGARIGTPSTLFAVPTARPRDRARRGGRVRGDRGPRGLQL